MLNPVGYYQVPLSPLLSLHLDATRVLGPSKALTDALADDTAISRIYDLSGNNFSPEQATVAKQPLFKTNIQNGLPGILGDGVDDFMQTTSNSVKMDPELNYCSIFVVSRCLTSTGYFVGKGSSNTTSSAMGWALGTTTGNIKQRAGTSTPTNIGDSSIIANETVSSIKEWYFTGSTLNYYLNGASNGSQRSYSVSVTTTRTFWLFGRDTNDNYANSYLHEVLVYKGSLSTSERLAVRTYLGNKWGISVI